MANILPDGTVIPSYFGVENMGVRQSANAFSNFVLRQGEIREVIYPDDPKSVSGMVVEYSVVVQVRDGNGPAVSVNYPNCTVANLFGGVADVFRYTLRAQSKEPDKGKTTSDGSKVLLLCVNGELRRAIIVGGINDDQSTAKQDFSSETKDDGHNLRFEFNGVQGTINKDGELQVRYRGATKIDDDLDDNANSDAEGSTIIFNKDGGIKVYTKDEKQFIFLDHANKKIDILADEEWHVKTNKKVNFEAGDAYHVQGDSTCTIETKDKIYLKSPGTYVGDATDAWMLGTTYRQAEGQMNQTVSGLLNSLASLISTAATALNAAATAQKVPIGGAVAASVPLQAAAVALTSAGPLFGQIGSAISQFEGNASSYLSTKNKND